MKVIFQIIKYIPKHELEMTDRLKNEVLTGYVSFTI